MVLSTGGPVMIRHLEKCGPFLLTLMLASLALVTILATVLTGQRTN